MRYKRKREEEEVKEVIEEGTVPFLSLASSKGDGTLLKKKTRSENYDPSNAFLFYRRWLARGVEVMVPIQAAVATQIYADTRDHQISQPNTTPSVTPPPGSAVISALPPSFPNPEPSHYANLVAPQVSQPTTSTSVTIPQPASVVPRVCRCQWHLYPSSAGGSHTAREVARREEQQSKGLSDFCRTS